MPSIDIISACYGDYDEIVAGPHLDIPGIRRWVMVTDGLVYVPYGWTVIQEPRPHVHPNVAAKVPKFLPSFYTDADFTIWIDASATPQASLTRAVGEALQHADWTMFPHPCRDDIGEEVLASRGLRKYDDLPLEAQTAHYYAQGYPAHGGLWATGCIGRRSSDVNTMFGALWLQEVVRWGFQDQLSFAYLQREQLKVHPLGPDLWTSPHIRFGGHRGG